MRITLDIDLGSDRMTVRDRQNDRVFFDDVAVIAIKQDAKQRPYIVGIGSDRIDREATRVVPVVSQHQFDSDLAASVAWYLAMKAWSDVRPGWRGLFMLIDRLDAHVKVEGYEHLSREQRDKLKKALRPYPRLTWLVGGEKVKR